MKLTYVTVFAASVILVPRIARSQEQSPVRVRTSLPPSVEQDSKQFVRVSTSAALGPMGYLQMPSGLTQVAGADPSLATVNGKYNFPSIYIYISASPLLLPQLADGAKPDSIDAVRDADRDINWMDASFDLVPLGSDGRPLPCGGNVQVIGLVPGATVTSTKTPAANTAASAANQLMTALAPFFPGVKSVGEASTSALQVLFTDLFPPKSVAYQYAFLDGACSFGWYYKANPTATPPLSILGVQTGLVLLRTTKDVASMEVSGRILSSWNKPPTSSSKQFSYVTTKSSLEIPNVTSAIDYGALQDLSLFPMLISAADARKVLHIGKDRDADWQGLITPKTGQAQPVLQTTPDGSYVMKTSLQQYLQLTK